MDDTQPKTADIPVTIRFPDHATIRFGAESAEVRTEQVEVRTGDEVLFDGRHLIIERKTAVTAQTPEDRSKVTRLFFESQRNYLFFLD